MVYQPSIARFFAVYTTRLATEMAPVVKLKRACLKREHENMNGEHSVCNYWVRQLSDSGAAVDKITLVHRIEKTKITDQMR